MEVAPVFMAGAGGFDAPRSGLSALLELTPGGAWVVASVVTAGLAEGVGFDDFTQCHPNHVMPKSSNAAINPRIGRRRWRRRRRLLVRAM
jgi:hypothetical protein